jgi:hypothetical protein
MSSISSVYSTYEENSQNHSCPIAENSVFEVAARTTNAMQLKVANSNGRNL